MWKYWVNIDLFILIVFGVDYITSTGANTISVPKYDNKVQNVMMFDSKTHVSLPMSMLNLSDINGERFKLSGNFYCIFVVLIQY